MLLLVSKKYHIHCFPWLKEIFSFFFVFSGLGLLFVHVYHLNSVFEQTTNFSKLNRLERVMLFRNEDSLYYYVYQTIAEAKDFRTGFEEILKNNLTQFPNTINLVEYFSILPEIVIA